MAVATAHKFLQDSEHKAFDLKHRATIKNNMSKYYGAVRTGLTQFSDHALARSRAQYLKTRAVSQLDKSLLEFEAKFTARGGKIIWARDGKEALQEIVKIFEEKQAKMVVKSKSMTTEEIHLNEYLEKRGIEAIETDLGEWIVQMAGQKPYHIVTPAMHMSKKDISDLFEEKLKTPATDDPQELTMIARRLLREKYTSAEIGITGGNFLVADLGAIAITENEGNARLTIAFPKTHIAVVGIEKVLPSLDDLGTLWPLLATHGTGQMVTVYNTLISGPRQEGEPDGPDEMIVVLLDNGRTKLLADAEKRQALNCIRCGACLNACPVYKNIGGHTYETTYSGPIGSIISPHYNGMEQFKHLSYASSLCGACTNVCPVRIDIHNLLLLNRAQSVEEGHAPMVERAGFKMWKLAMKRRATMDLGNGGLKTWAVNAVFGGLWGKRRSEIKFAPKNFRELWLDRQKNKEGR